MALRGILRGRIKEHFDLRLAEGRTPGFQELLREVRRYSGVKRMEAREKNTKSGGMEIGNVYTSSSEERAAEDWGTHDWGTGDD